MLIKNNTIITYKIVSLLLDTALTSLCYFNVLGMCPLLQDRFTRVQYNSNISGEFTAIITCSSENNNSLYKLKCKADGEWTNNAINICRNQTEG